MAIFLTEGESAIRISGREGVPMTSVEGAIMRFRDVSGARRGAQIVHKDGSTFELDDEKDIDDFSEFVGKLTDFERKTLIDFNNLAYSILKNELEGTRTMNSETKKLSMAQMVNANIPFNPLAEGEILGEKANQLTHAMKVMGWKDPRFVTRNQAADFGWLVAEKALSVQVLYRNEIKGDFEPVELFNASDINGIPSLGEMVKMSESDIGDLKSDLDSDVIEIQPVIEQVRSLEPTLSVNDVQRETVNDQKWLEEAGLGVDNIYAAMSPYWINGLYNAAGIALAEEINNSIKKLKLSKDKEAVRKFIASFPEANKLQLSLVTEQDLLNNLDYKNDLARPKFLLGNSFVRDREGEYRPAAGGRSVVKDNGDTLVLKSKTPESYRAAMELAKAKGWSAIELKGTSAALADAWLEAKLIGIDVVNYSPSKDDLQKYGERLAEEQARKAVEEQPVFESRATTQSQEHVELRPYIGLEGETKFAEISYVVTFPGGQDVNFTDPKEAIVAFSKIPSEKQPAIVHVVARADGSIESENILASTKQFELGGKLVKSLTPRSLNQAFNEAFKEVVGEEKEHDLLNINFANFGRHIGQILDVKNGVVTQSLGRGNIVHHKASSFDKLPEKGSIEEIHYKQGKANLKARDLGRENSQELSR